MWMKSFIFSHELLNTGLPAVREKSGKIFIFQGQGKVREFCKKSGKIFEYGKVREKSGNFVMNACDTCFITVLHLYDPYFSAMYGPRWENPCIFFYAMWYFPPIKVSWEGNGVCWTQFFFYLFRLRHDTYYLIFCFTSKFSFALHEAKSVTVPLKILFVLTAQVWKRKSSQFASFCLIEEAVLTSV